MPDLINKASNLHNNLQTIIHKSFNTLTFVPHLPWADPVVFCSGCIPLVVFSSQMPDLINKASNLHNNLQTIIHKSFNTLTFVPHLPWADPVVFCSGCIPLVVFSPGLSPCLIVFNQVVSITRFYPRLSPCCWG
jgi:enamine deaminase RidA (YjgF/YER057c/UK114 family)